MLASEQLSQDVISLARDSAPVDGTIFYAFGLPSPRPFPSREYECPSQMQSTCNSEFHTREAPVKDGKTLKSFNTLGCIREPR